MLSTRIAQIIDRRDSSDEKAGAILFYLAGAIRQHFDPTSLIDLPPLEERPTYMNVSAWLREEARGKP